MLSPHTQAQWKRFRSIRRAYFSLLVLICVTILSLCAELFCSHRALFVSYQGRWHFPAYGAAIPGQVFGLEYDYETNYRELAEKFKGDRKGDWLILPLIPYGPTESDFRNAVPSRPDVAARHFLGTDSMGRDICARLIYGFRIGIGFAILLAACQYILGIGLGLLMGYRGGLLDILGQRLVEIWDNIPILYIVITLAALFSPSFWTLLLILVAFGWVAKTQTMRALTLREKAKDYVLAARALGFSSGHIMLKEILPNTLPIMLALIPFTIEGSFTALTIYDYLGFGLPAPTPSWGELLKQGAGQVSTAPWIAASVVTCLVLLLLMITFIGEAFREAGDPKQLTRYL